MQKFKAIVHKSNKQYTFVFSALNKTEAKEKMHKDGYSIMNIEEFSGDGLGGHMFFFEIEKNGEIKKGKALGNDIFKVYVNLRKNLGYNVLKLYGEKESDKGQDYYKKITTELEEEYQILILNKKNDKVEEIKTKPNVDKNGFENFYLKKDLEETYKLINFILLKLKNIIEGKELKNLDNLSLMKIKEVTNGIKKIKKTTNIAKLKDVGELALLKIGKLEKDSLEKKEDKQVKNLLKQTNILLKKIGSKKQVIENKYNYLLIVKNFFNNLKNGIKDIIGKKENKKTNKIDTESYYYIKNELLLKKYREKLKLNKKQIIKNIFNSKKREDSFIRRNVIKQNIIILKAKKKGVFYSYTKLKNGYKHLVEKVVTLIKNIRKGIFFIIITYTILFLFYINLSFYIYNIGKYINMDYLNYKGIFYFIIILFLYIILFLSRNLISIIVNSFLIISIVIVGVINF